MESLTNIFDSVVKFFKSPEKKEEKKIEEEKKEEKKVEEEKKEEKKVEEKKTITKICIKCGKSFIVASQYGNKDFCSRKECFDTKVKNCEACGKIFILESGKLWAEQCSTECWKQIAKDYVCEVCGETYKSTPRQIAKGWTKCRNCYKPKYVKREEHSVKADS